MQHFDRILGILLFLRSKQSISASELARHFEVSIRTVYRDLDTLSSLGVPLYGERGRKGGIRLLQGYFLPPLMFTQGEAIALLLGLTLQRSLRAAPFPAEIEMAEKKLLAALPENLRVLLTKAERLVGFEKTPSDIFHPEPDSPEVMEQRGERGALDLQQSKTITTFFQAVLDGKQVAIQYASPYRSRVSEVLAEPLGLLWDRDRWYLAARSERRKYPLELWRADRVVAIKPRHSLTITQERQFDVRDLLGRNWLRSAMEEWRQMAPVKIRLTPAHVERLQQDWYYRHASFEPQEDGWVLMTYGEGDPVLVLELLRWLGPGAELVEPQAWRAKICEELRQMLAMYTSTISGN